MLVYLALIFCAVFFSTLWMLTLLRKKNDPANRRLQNLQTADQETLSSMVPVKRPPATGHRIDRLLSRLGGSKKPQEDKKPSRLQKAMVQAGFQQDASVQVFVAIRTFLALLFMIMYGYLTHYMGRPTDQVVLFGLAMGIVGYILPEVVLNMKVRRRQQEIAAALPDTLDLLVISVEAGLGLNAALLRVGQDIRLRSAALSEELLMINHDMRTGITREKALRRLAERNKVESLRILVGALVLADRLGTGIADTLRVQADSLRTRVRQKMEEQAAKSGIKMLFPLVLFILPALFIVLLGPGMLALSKSFSQIATK
jgi:tight adherence protein C